MHQQTTAFENIVGKEEIAPDEQFLLFQQCFLLNQKIFLTSYQGPKTFRTLTCPPLFCTRPTVRQRGIIHLPSTIFFLEGQADEWILWTLHIFICC